MQRCSPTRRRAEGLITRGKTAPNRLRRVDHFLLRYDPGLLTRRDGPYARALFVDLGYGAEPTTTLESAARLRRLSPGLPVLGVEIDPERVTRALPHADDHTMFRLGGFNLPLGTWADGEPETVRLVRAFNVLRQYDEAAVRAAFDRLCEALLPGGLLIEGTSDPFGRIWTANLVRRGPAADPTAWRVEALVFSTGFQLEFDPADFRAILPKNLIHRAGADSAIARFVTDWQRAADETRGLSVWGPRQHFAGAATRLAALGYDLDLHRAWLRRGWLIWRRPEDALR